MVKKLGNGRNTRFWQDIWIDSRPIREVFPRLHSMSNQLDCTVHSMGRWIDDCWYWELSWRRQFFVWEEDLVHQLMRMLSCVKLDSTEDSWVSAIGDDGKYTV
ncbi:hypothetical protein QL285_011091 [Trifolium repens]|jgi:hypothetical protein|nr:hypothetical protein QL285_011091 [Trifolium repens]